MHTNVNLIITMDAIPLILGCLKDQWIMLPKPHSLRLLPCYHTLESHAHLSGGYPMQLRSLLLLTTFTPLTHPHTPHTQVETQCDYGYSLGGDWKGPSGLFSASPDPLMGDKFAKK